MAIYLDYSTILKSTFRWEVKKAQKQLFPICLFLTQMIFIWFLLSLETGYNRLYPSGFTEWHPKAN